MSAKTPIAEYPLLDAISHALQNVDSTRATDLDFLALQAFALELNYASGFFSSIARDGVPAKDLAYAVAQFVGKFQLVVMVLLEARIRMLAERGRNDEKR